MSLTSPRHDWDVTGSVKTYTSQVEHQYLKKLQFNLILGKMAKHFNPLNAELNPICYLLALLGVHHFLHVSRIRVKSLTLRLLMSYIYMYDISSLRVNAGNAITVYRPHIVSLSWAITRGYSWVRHVPWLGMLVQSHWVQILMCTIIFIIKPEHYGTSVHYGR